MEQLSIVSCREPGSAELVTGTVRMTAEDSFVVELPGALATVRRAASCLVRPEIGDTALVFRDANHEGFILSVLVRAAVGTVTLGFDRGVSFETGTGPFAVDAPEVRIEAEHRMSLTGEELAGARGVNVDRTKKWLFFSASLMTGAAVAFCGPIAFVGLMVPHIGRQLIGSDHRKLFPAVILLGGAFLVICDGLARTLLAPVEMPAGLITALLGGPFFLWLLLRKA